jgi:signal transduction histidine kinase
MRDPLRNWRLSDPEIFRQQERIFCVLNLVVIVSLLCANYFLARFWGPITPFLFCTLLFGFSAYLFLLFWIQYRAGRPDSPSINLTTVSILLNTILTLAASTTNRDDSQYYVLMCVPVLQAAFHYSLRGTLGVVLLANCLNFFWLWQYSRLHAGGVEVDEYVEAGTVSFIYTVTALVVWLLVDRLRREKLSLADSLEQLTRTRTQLLEEEKLAAVGRLAAGLANEFRNPVASIVDSLSDGHSSSFTPEQRELLALLHTESSRLDKLSSHFLAYAYPCTPIRAQVNAALILRSVADACRGAAAAKVIKLSITAPSDLPALLDESQIHQALLHLLNNAIEASPPRKTIYLRADRRSTGGVQFEVQNAGPPLSPEALPLLFEPFFASKAPGGGLSLAITRNICRTHGGEVSLTQNDHSAVCFTITLPAVPAPQPQPQPETTPIP